MSTEVNVQTTLQTGSDASEMLSVLDDLYQVADKMDAVADRLETQHGATITFTADGSGNLTINVDK